MKMKSTLGRLEDKVALITGAGGTNSIGRSIALRFAAEGAKVGVTSVDGKSAATVADEIVAEGGEAIAVACDERWTLPLGPGGRFYTLGQATALILGRIAL